MQFQLSFSFQLMHMRIIGDADTKATTRLENH